MNRKERREKGKQNDRIYVPVKCSATKYKPRNDIPPRSREIGRTCVRRWTVMTKGGVLCGFRQRRIAMKQRKPGTPLPELVTIRSAFGEVL